jgi:hypothetical protein
MTWGRTPGTLHNRTREEALMTGDYPLIADHGLIGDLQTAALLSWLTSSRSMIGQVADLG